MKIVCDNCATKYQIADEKVSGKAFKIRCKKCGHVIVVNKGPGEAGAGQAPAPEASVNQEPSAPAAEAAPPSDAVWHLVIDREQVGPMTPDEVRTKVRSGQVDSETYGWREGFDDWLKLSAIEDFKSLFAGGGDDQSTRRTSNGERDSSAGGGAPPGADLFGGMNEPIKTAAPGAATIVSDGMHAPDLAALGLTPSHTAPASAPTQMSAPDAAPTQMAAPRASAAAQAHSDGGGSMDAPVKSMAGARSENSVLFSLNNLSALAGGSGGGGGGGGGGSASASKAQGADKPGYANAQSEASGLIDIRAMAAATLGSQSVGGPGQLSRGPDLIGGNDAAPVFTPLAPAILMPTAESSGVPKWVFALVGLGVLMFAGMILTLVLVLRDPTPGPVATGGGTTKETPTTSGTGTTIVTTPPKETPGTSAGTTTAPPTKESPTTKPSGSSEKPSGEKKGKEPKSSDSGSKKEPKHEAKPEKAPEPPAPKNEPVAPPPKKEKPAKAKDDLDSLLDGASGGSGGKPAKVEKEDLPEQLSMSAVQSTLKGVNVASCKGEGASGVINVKLTIGKDGKVSSANPSGGAAGGDCVAGKVKSAKFPRFSGDPMTLTFPFIVR